jgi:hypothetical protein
MKTMASTLLKGASLSLLIVLFGCSEQANEQPKLENTAGVSLSNVKQHIASDNDQRRGPLT